MDGWALHEFDAVLGEDLPVLGELAPVTVGLPQDDDAPLPQRVQDAGDVELAVVEVDEEGRCAEYCRWKSLAPLGFLLAAIIAPCGEMRKEKATIVPKAREFHRAIWERRR